MTAPALAPDAAIVLGIASAALPFACTPEDAAERWLRVLRLHGQAGAALQALGVSEEPLRRSAEEEEREWAPSAEGDRDAVARVLENAAGYADRHGAAGVATADVLMAVMDVYGADFERVLRAHGTDRDEVIEQLRAA
jgi:ATP-dependent Clp protease ATP-binding subunit ClpA